MLTTEAQQKIINALLKRPQNLYCSDCNGKSPCWASLDFGVFVCMNCSGAHRALGPSITRVKSTKLDTWNKDWVENMKIGNSILNEYWQKQLPAMPNNTKPNVNSSLNEIKKYVFDKYLKKKFIDSNEELDPLTKLKKGVLTIKTQTEKSSGVQEKNNNNKSAVNNNQQNTNTGNSNNQNSKNTLNSANNPVSHQQSHHFKKQNPFQSVSTKANKNVDANENGNKKQKLELMDFNDTNNVQKTQQNHYPNAHHHNVGGNHDPNHNKHNKHHYQSHNVQLGSNNKNMSFQNFFDNVSNKSVSSSGNDKNMPAIHGNYFMSPQGFVNSGHHDPHHGYSLPSNNNVFHNNSCINNQLNTGQNPIHPQVTMNINMNMYPNVMNINMGSCSNPNQNFLGHNQGSSIKGPNTFTNQYQNSINKNPPPFNFTLDNSGNVLSNTNQAQQNHINHSSTTSNLNNVKQFEFNDFFTSNIKPPRPSSNLQQPSNSITLQVTIKQNNQKQSKSWIEEWM